MILPIYAYGHQVLKSKAEHIDADYDGLSELIENMWTTMYNARGVGLAAPQIGRSIRLFLVDSTQMEEEGKPFKGIKQVFINAQIVEESGESWKYEEGCLSIPDVRGDVKRQANVVIEYMDENFESHRKTFTGLNARVIQHEYDHIEGILFTELLAPLRKRRVKRSLERIKAGSIQPDYRMKFA